MAAAARSSYEAISVCPWTCTKRRPRRRRRSIRLLLSQQAPTSTRAASSAGTLEVRACVCSATAHHSLPHRVLPLSSGDDVLEALFSSLQLPQLCLVKRLSRAWRAVARRVLTNPQWQASHLSLMQLLQLDAGDAAALARLRRCPAEASTKDEGDRYTLHVACAGGASGSVFSEALVRALLEVHPDAARKRDPFGLTPLHVAAQAAAPAPILDVRA